jgi:hypothetical protein
VTFTMVWPCSRTLSRRNDSTQAAGQVQDTVVDADGYVSGKVDANRKLPAGHGQQACGVDGPFDLDRRARLPTGGARPQGSSSHCNPWGRRPSWSWSRLQSGRLAVNSDGPARRARSVYTEERRIIEVRP